LLRRRLRYGAVVGQIILERVANIAMEAESDNLAEFEDLARSAVDAPTALAMLD
jgi:tartronate-semialdehyde synthase